MTNQDMQRTTASRLAAALKKQGVNAFWRNFPHRTSCASHIGRRMREHGIMETFNVYADGIGVFFITEDCKIASSAQEHESAFMFLADYLGIDIDDVLNILCPCFYDVDYFATARVSHFYETFKLQEP